MNDIVFYNHQLTQTVSLMKTCHQSNNMAKKKDAASQVIKPFEK